MEKVLLTGGAGFVGANLVRRLIKEEYEVHLIVRERSNLWRINDIINKINIHKIDLLENEKLNKLVLEIKPENIIHLAIYGGRPNQENENEILNINLIGTMNLVNALDKVDYTCFINTGSSSEYGKKNKPMKEEDRCNPMNMYGISKVASTMYCQYKALTENRNIGTIRLFSPFGDYEDKGRLIPDLILGSLIDKTVRLANPTAVRDYIYIEDVCDLYIKILKDPLKIKGEIFNLGFGKHHSVQFMAETTKKLISTKVELKYNELNGRKADTDIWVADIKKVKQVFKWEPRYSMEEGLKKSIEWFENNLNLYNIKEK